MPKYEILNHNLWLLKNKTASRLQCQTRESGDAFAD